MIIVVVSTLLFTISISACSKRADITSTGNPGSSSEARTTGYSTSVLENADNSADTRQNDSANSNADNNRAGSSDTTYVLPPEAEFTSFVETRLYEEINSGRLLLNTALERPIELAVRNYHIPGSSPEIGLNAVVFEEEVGAENGKAITHQVVEIMLEWLNREGFEPFGTFMMPISYVCMDTVDEAGNRDKIFWDSSMYNPFTGIIE